MEIPRPGTMQLAQPLAPRKRIERFLNFIHIIILYTHMG